MGYATAKAMPITSATAKIPATTVPAPHSNKRKDHFANVERGLGAGDGALDVGFEGITNGVPKKAEGNESYVNCPHFAFTLGMVSEVDLAHVPGTMR